MLLSHVDIRQVGARRLGCVSFGTEPHGQDNGGKTPVHKAVRQRQRDTVQILVDAGADVILLNDP